MKTYIMVRRATDDYNALMTAQGMTNAGADVFSVTLSTMESYQFMVWAKISGPVTPEIVDGHIEKLL